MYEIKRTPEQGHTRACLAKAMITAIENLRDMDEVRDAWLRRHSQRGEGPAFESSLDFDFRVAVQKNEALTMADGYLADGTTECICPTPDPTPTDLLPEDALTDLRGILEDIDSPDLVIADDAQEDMRGWVARNLGEDTPWEPIIGTDLSTTGVEYWDVEYGTVRLVVRPTR